MPLHFKGLNSEFFQAITLTYVYLQDIIQAAALILDVKLVKYQHNFFPGFCLDFIVHFFAIPIIPRIVGRQNGADDICENLLV